MMKTFKKRYIEIIQSLVVIILLVGIGLLGREISHTRQEYADISTCHVSPVEYGQMILTGILAYIECDMEEEPIITNN